MKKLIVVLLTTIVTLLTTTVVLLSTIIISIIMIYFTTFHGVYGRYFGHGFIWVTSEYTGLHEVGHFVDESCGWPSQSFEFQDVTDLAYFSFEDPEPNYYELYAKMYAKVKQGKLEMPKDLVQYFDCE